MNQFSDEQIMAFADGELDAETAAAVSAALPVDAALAARVAQHRALRQTVFASFASVLDEPIPARLQQAANAPTHTAPILSLVGSSASLPTSGKRSLRERFAPTQWGALAATLIVGVMAGIVGSHALRSGADTVGSDNLAFASVGGTLVAQHQLATALSEQLSSTPTASAPARIGVTFRATDGNFCRSFTLAAAPAQAHPMAGLACRSSAGDNWQIPMLVQADGNATDGNSFRTAGSATPNPILHEIDRRMVGAPLDRAAEQAALARHWKP